MALAFKVMTDPLGRLTFLEYTQEKQKVDLILLILREDTETIRKTIKCMPITAKKSKLFIWRYAAVIGLKEQLLVTL